MFCYKVCIVLLSGFMITAMASAGGDESDPLAELLQTLDRFSESGPVQGELTVEISTRSNDDDGDALEVIGTAIARIGAGSEGVQIHVPVKQLEAVRKAAADHPDGTKDTPSAALQEITGTLADDLMNAAAALKRALKHAEFEQECSVSGMEPGTREWVFRLSPPMSEKEKKRLREHDMTLTVIILPDGTPVETRFRRRLRARMMLMGFEIQSDEILRYETVGDRLVTIYRELQERGSGMGQSGESRKVYRWIPSELEREAESGSTTRMTDDASDT